jgi:hypothetical protein
LVLDVQRIIPLPEAAEYQVKIQEKRREERHAQARSGGKMASIRESAVQMLRERNPEGMRLGDLVDQLEKETGYTDGEIRNAIWDLDQKATDVEKVDRGVYRIRLLQHASPSTPIADAGTDIRLLQS